MVEPDDDSYMKYNVKWSNHYHHIFHAFSELHRDNAYYDVVLQTNRSTDPPIKGHKLLFAASSTYFAVSISYVFKIAKKFSLKIDFSQIPFLVFFVPSIIFCVGLKSIRFIF